MNDDQKKNSSPPPPQNRSGQPSRRPPLSIFIWLLILMMIVTLFVYKYNPAVGAREEWSQTKFEKKLTAGDIKTAVITPESENVLYIEGEYRKNLRQANSDVKIYVQSLFPVSKERSDKNLYGVTNERIVDYNNMLKKLCDEKGVKYIDVYSAMVTEDGVLEDGASPDGVHPNMQYCETWVQYLRDHC